VPSLPVLWQTDEDVDATIDMMRTLRAEAPRLHFTLGCSTFVPKVRRESSLPPGALRVRKLCAHVW